MESYNILNIQNLSSNIMLFYLRSFEVYYLQLIKNVTFTDCKAVLYIRTGAIKVWIFQLIASICAIN